MNVEEYIASGILEAYVLDQLDEKEQAEVTQYAQIYPQIQQEIERIALTMEKLALATAVSPKNTKSQLLAQLNSEEKKEIPLSNKDKPSNRILQYATAASMILAICALFLAYSYCTKWQNTQEQLTDLLAQNQQFADNYNLVNRELDDLQDAIAIMNNSAFRRVVMNGTEKAPQALAVVYWNEATQDVFLNIQNLKALSQDQQYQLWAIIDGKPVDAGVFDLTTDKLLVQMNAIGAGAVAFAVTVEPKGGSENPSLETMQVIGNV